MRASVSGRRVLVAGGAGFIGSQVVRDLLADGASVFVFDDLSYGDAAHLAEVRGDVRLTTADVLDEAALDAAFRSARPDYVVDLVGDTFVPSAYHDPRRFFRVNVEGTLNLLSAARRHGVERFLYTSSTEVYGEADGRPADERHGFDPRNTYAVSKLAADRLCFTYHAEHGVPVIVARVFNSYGPRATHPYVIPEIISQLSRGPRVELGNVDARRDFTFVGDTSRGLLAALCSTIPDGEAVNVGSGSTHSVREIADVVAELCGYGAYELRRDPARLRRLDVHEFLCDAAKLREATGWQPRVSLRDGLSRTLDAYRAAGSDWSWERRCSPEAPLASRRVEAG